MKKLKLIGVMIWAVATLSTGCTATINHTGEKQADSTPQTGVDVVQYVDPFIGTGGHGHTYPGAVVPFGMVQLSPDNPSKGWDWTSGYHYSDDTLVGFSHTHLSGTGVGDLLDILVMPYRGEYASREKDEKGRISTKYSHTQESASAGYYSVVLPGEQVTAELSATTRVGMHRYQFAGKQPAKVFIDLGYAQNFDQAVVTFIRVDSPTRISGYRLSTGWAKKQPVYFVAEFNQPFRYQLYENAKPIEGATAHGKHSQVSLDFGDLSGQALVAKVALSYTGIHGAEKNMAAEVADFNFDAVRAQAKQRWQQQLSKFIVAGSTTNKTKFYTALYHAFLAPHEFSDVDGSFFGGDGAVHPPQGYPRYTLFSLWDTFRTLQPLLTISNPERIDGMVQSMLGFYDETGLLPSWEFVGNETDVMIGYHGVPVVVDAYLKGLTRVDGERLFQAVKASATQHRFGIHHYAEYGYVPSDLELEAVSKTLEYAFDDWAIAQLAKHLNKPDEYQVFMQRAMSYKKLYDANTGFMRGKKSNGEWVSPFDPTRVEHRKNDYTEANAWQYTWFVPQDVPGLIALMGGEQAFVKQLDALFTTKAKMSGDVSPDISGLISQYVHGNEPCHHIPYMYAYTSEPWKGEQRIKQILNTMYKAEPDGLAGNDDVGQMSSWFVMSALGFYPMNPVSGEYVVGTPLFENASLALPGGKTLQVKRVGPEQGYVKKVWLNGNELSERRFSHQQLLQGGVLRFEMSERKSM